MKKLLACILLLAPLTGWADTVTSRLSLTQPDINSANWGTKLNNNFGLVDAGVGVLGKTNNWTGTNNFTGPISISSYTNITSSVAFSTISVVNLTATNATISSATIANASITGFLVNVSTVVASSATFTNANVTGILTAGTANVSGNESLTGTLTVTSSSTLKGNVGINGNVNQPLTVTSSTTFTGNGEIDGTVKLGSAGNQVTISSNAVIGNTTFYPDAPMRTSSMTMVAGTFTFPDASTQTVSARPGRIIQRQTFSATSASATATTSVYIPTNLTGSFTPLFANSLIRITMMGSLESSSISACDCVTTIYRNPGTTNLDLSPSAGNGLCYVGDGNSAINITVPCTMVAYDNPQTASAITYTTMMKMSAGGGTCTLTKHNVSVMIVEEISQ